MMFDIAVIGGGPAGYTAALEAANRGKSVVLFEERELGGTCLNRGCVPTKFLSHAAELLLQTANFGRYGISAKTISLDYIKTYEENMSVIRKLRDGLTELLEQGNIKIVSNRAELLDETHISDGNDVYECRSVIIATGSVPSAPFITGAITSDEIFNLKQVPNTLKIIGGGIVAVEFAHIFNALGADVTICIRGDRILRKWDREISVGLSQSLKKKGIKILTKCTPEILAQCDADVVLSATGRVPNLIKAPDGMLTFGEDGGIIADDCGRTQTAGVYACGDVISGSVQLAHVAMEQAKRSVRDICGEKQPPLCAVVNCIYTCPEAVSVGMTEVDAKAAGLEVLSAKQVMSSNARTLIVSDDRGFIKIVAEKSSGIIVGAQLLCERACEIGSELALAINNNFTVEQLANSTRPHPSFCEAVTAASETWLKKVRQI